MAQVTVWRRLRFNAAHRVHNPALSDAENARLFAKCNNPNWHGHNYELEVGVRGPIDPVTGYVIDLGTVREVVEREVIDQIDHRNLNLDVPWLTGVNPTTENLVVHFWARIASAIAPAQLVTLRLRETENNYVEYSGE
jgi:6-pyruvoyltetrahydropterin/6-carboxytetrahydropterin synthase